MPDTIPLVVSDEEYQAYLRQEKELEASLAKKRNAWPRTVDRLSDLMLVDGADVEYTVHYRTPIRRVRRITGYFSTIDRFNDAKLAELNDRQPHSMTMVNTSGRTEHVGIEDAMLERLTMERELAAEGYVVSLDGQGN